MKMCDLLSFIVNLRASFETSLKLKYPLWLPKYCLTHMISKFGTFFHLVLILLMPAMPLKIHTFLPCQNVLGSGSVHCF